MPREARTTFLRTRVGRRMVLLFVACALVPTTIMGAVVYRMAQRQLTRQSDRRLKRDAKAYAMELVGRLGELRDALARVTATLDMTAATPVELDSLFRAVVIREGRGARSEGEGMRAASLPTLREWQLRRAEMGDVVLAVAPGKEPVLWLTRSVMRAGRRAFVWAAIDPHFLWGPWAQATEAGSVCVFEQATRRTIFCPIDASEVVPLQLASAREVPADSLSVSYTRGNEHFRAARWDLFLRFEFAVDGWTIVVSEPANVTYADAATLARTMALLAALTVFFVLWLSSVQIRRSTRPLEALQQGTQRVARGDYRSLVQITSGDEYEQLASSFNSMASAIHRQMGILTTMDAIDGEALGPRDIARMIPPVLAQVVQLVPGATVSVGVLTPGLTESVQLTTSDGVNGAVRHDDIFLSADDRRELLDHPRHLTLGAREGNGSPARLPGALILPLVDRDELIGLVSVSMDAGAPPVAILGDARRLADRLAQAIAHIRLVQRLDDLSLGALTSFARAIDANSPWTAGHSERVTRLAMATGRRLGLSDGELDVLQRGGLLHDVGKIGVPPLILDKPGKLTDAEMALMQKHPDLGQRILAPIAAFADALPIVRSHHERVDGGGYPDRLAGEDIPWLARVLAVSDVYDALVSDRPYRAGWAPDAALSHLRAIAGTHLDARAVNAFVAATMEGDVAKVYENSEDARDLARAVSAGRHLIGVRT